MNNIEQAVTRQEAWEIQICDNMSGSFRTLCKFREEQSAKDTYSNIKFRLVQKALIDVGGYNE